MDTGEQAATSLRDSISQAFDQVESGITAQDAPAIDLNPTPKEAPQIEGPEKQADGRTAGRPRDAQGRLLPGKPDKPEPAQAAPAQQTAPAQQQERKRPQYPSTWKKDFAQKWETLDNDIAEEIARREGDYAKGVSTYKGEYDRLKPIDEALKPYTAFMQHVGMKPEQFVSGLAQSDQVLRYGSKEDKLRMFARLAQDYQIPVNEMLVRGEDGNIYFNQQLLQQQQQAQQSANLTAQDVDKLLSQRMAAMQVQAAVQQFIAAKDQSGNPLYPHFDQVKQTMDGLLRAGLAKDLPDSYAKALLLPEHAQLLAAQQQQQRESEQQADIRKKAEAAARARASGVSVKSQPATGTADGKASTAKGLREQLSEAYDQLAGTGRI